ncbi:glycosyltransferase family 2 protein [Seleniivibrio woodruffii]|uniref:glycosyltransferase family 2 protein n=1 Tax=Seleniivibrio woodruffii TaxID=1078050 RepID=UPI0026E9F7E6|nr:glycosyltransferase family 2 protein [Seleniivibrio woodruffii]
MKRVSIVTIVKNDSAGLEKTIKSVTAQTFRDYELIVADGGSENSTLSVINRLKGCIDIFLEGPDKGIYDGMNKGIAAAQGTYIIFMNAGDVFASPDALENVFGAVTGEPDVIYGDYRVNYGYTEKLIKGAPVGNIWKGMLTSHQSTLVRTGLMKKHPFRLGVRIGADFDRLFHLYSAGASFVYVPVTVSVTEPGGVSDRKRVQVYKDHFQTLTEHNAAGLSRRLYYIYITTDAFLRLTAKRLLPREAVRRFITSRAEK